MITGPRTDNTIFSSVKQLMIRFLVSTETNPYHFHYKLSLHSLPESLNFAQLPHYHVSQNLTSHFPKNRITNTCIITFLIKSSTTHFHMQACIIKTDTADGQRPKTTTTLYRNCLVYDLLLQNTPTNSLQITLSHGYPTAFTNDDLLKSRPFNNNLQFTTAANITNTLELTKLYTASYTNTITRLSPNPPKLTATLQNFIL